MNRRVFDTHYRNHFREIYTFLFQQIQNKEESLELTQDVFVALYKRMSEENDIEQVRPWLYGVARYKVLGRYKTTNKPWVVGSLEQADEAELVADDVERELQRRAVLQWIEQQLEHENFQMLLLYLQGFSNRELSEMFGLSEVVIKKRLQRTREQTLAYFRNV